MKTSELNDIYPGVDDFFAAQKDYLEKFGEKSLSHTIYDDPLRPECINFEDATRRLRRAIQRNESVEQIANEILDGIVF